MDVFDLVATLSLDTSKYESGLSGALGSAAKIGGAAVMAVAGATTAMTGALVSGAQDVAEYGDNIDKMSQKLGISAEAYQEWDAVMQHSGASIESLKPSIKTLATQAEKGNEAFQKLGISEEELKNLSQEDLFAKVIAGLQGMEEGTERTYIASQLLGRGATELGALLNTSAEDTEAMRKRVHELGGVMSDEAVKASAAFQDSLQDMTTSFDGLKRNMLSQFLPSMTKVTDGLANIFSGDTDLGLEQISNGISGFVNEISAHIPEILEIGANIISALASAIMENLPMLIESGTNILINLAQGLIEALPTIAESALQILMQLSDSMIENLPLLIDAAGQAILQIALGLAEALPDLIPAVVEIVLTIVESLIDNIDLLIDAAIALTMGLAEGLINALPILIEKAPVIIQKLVDALVQNLPQLVEVALQLIVTLSEALVENLPALLDAAVQIVFAIIDGIFSAQAELINVATDIIGFIGEGIGYAIEDALKWGSDLIDNFVEGIKGAIGNVIDVIKLVADKIKVFLGFSEPEEGPLSNFHTYAPDMMNLFMKGVRDNAKALQDTVADAFDFADAATSPEMAFNTPNFKRGNSGINNGSMSSAVYDENNGSAVIVLELDGTQLAKTVYNLNLSESRRVGMRLANV